MNENYNYCYPRKTTCTCIYIYIKQKKVWNVFISKKWDTLQKARQFQLRFNIQKVRHFTLRDFYENSEVGIYIQKAWNFALRDVLYTKSQTLRKKKDSLRYVLYSKSRKLCVTQFFIEFLKLAEGEGAIFICEIRCTLYYIFICKKNALCVTFYIQKALDFALHFCTQKKCTLRYVYI